MSLSLEKKLQKAFDLHWEVANQYYEGLVKPKVVMKEVEELGSCAGYALLDDNVIELNDYYLETETENMLSVILPHEICHIIQSQAYPKETRHHGKVWRNIMREVYGLKPCAYHTFDSQKLIDAGIVLVRTKSRYRYRCKCRKHHRVTKNRHEKLQETVQNCKKCGVKLKYTGKTESFL